MIRSSYMSQASQKVQRTDGVGIYQARFGKSNVLSSVGVFSVT